MSDLNKSRSLDIHTQKLFGEYLKDDRINEICFNGNGNIYLQDFQGNWEEKSLNITYEEILAFAVTLASFKEDVIKNQKPILSATLNNGERVQVIIPPVTKKGKISVTIRKPSKVRYSFSDYQKQGVFNKIVHKVKNELSNTDKFLLELYKNNNWYEFISESVKLGKNIIVSGSTNSGKTTFMKSLIDFIPKEERIITIEDTEEISFSEHTNYVQLFYPSEAKEGDLITSATLLKSVLRMTPNRIILAELRGGETFDYLQILNSGHGGSITSIHAGDVAKTFKRLHSLIIMNPQGQKLPFEVIEDSIYDVVDVVIHFENHHGKRVISDVYFKGADSVVR